LEFSFIHSIGVELKCIQVLKLQGNHFDCLRMNLS